MGAAVAVVAHVPNHAPGLARASGIGDAKVIHRTRPEPSAHVASALAASGLSQGTLAAACDVSQPTVARWCDPEQPSLPNLGHLTAAPRVVRAPLGRGLLADLDAREPVLPVAAFEREMLTIVTEMGAVYGKASAFLAVNDRASALALAGQVSQLRDRLRRLERAAVAAAAAWDRGAR